MCEEPTDYSCVMKQDKPQPDLSEKEVVVVISVGNIVEEWLVRIEITVQQEIEHLKVHQGRQSKPGQCLSGKTYSLVPVYGGCCNSPGIQIHCTQNFPPLEES